MKKKQFRPVKVKELSLNIDMPGSTYRTPNSRTQAVKLANFQQLKWQNITFQAFQSQCIFRPISPVKPAAQTKTTIFIKPKRSIDFKYDSTKLPALSNKREETLYL